MKVDFLYFVSYWINKIHFKYTFKKLYNYYYFIKNY